MTQQSVPSSSDHLRSQLLQTRSGILNRDPESKTAFLQRGLHLHLVPPRVLFAPLQDPTPRTLLCLLETPKVPHGAYGSVARREATCSGAKPQPRAPVSRFYHLQP